MRKIVNLCKLYYGVEWLTRIAKIMFLAVSVGIIILEILTTGNLSLVVFEMIAMAGVPTLVLVILTRFLHKKSRRLVCSELKYLIETYLTLNNDTTKVKYIYVNESEYTNTYTITLTRNRDIRECEGLLINLNYLKNNVAIALKKIVQIYCHGIVIE